jgi:hypothetical protein
VALEDRLNIACGALGSWTYEKFEVKRAQGSQQSIDARGTSALNVRNRSLAHPDFRGELFLGQSLSAPPFPNGISYLKWRASDGLHDVLSPRREFRRFFA